MLLLNSLLCSLRLVKLVKFSKTPPLINPVLSSSQPVPGGKECVQCPEFTYQPRNGSSECIPCSEKDQISAPQLISAPLQCGVLGQAASRDSPLVCALDRYSSDVL